MSYDEREVRRMLKEAHAVLARCRKHEVWRFPNGSIAVLPSTPGDRRAWVNARLELAAQLGLLGERGGEGERRERPTPAPRCPTAPTELTAGPLPTLGTALRRVRAKTIKHPQPVAPRPRPAGPAPAVDLTGLLNRRNWSR